MDILGSAQAGSDMPQLGSDSLMRILRAVAEAIEGYKLECSSNRPR
jgi:hypothetical protein